MKFLTIISIKTNKDIKGFPKYANDHIIIKYIKKEDQLVIKVLDSLERK